MLPALRPLFGDVGFTLDAPAPARWYLRLPRDARLPAFVDPAEALGADMFDHLPGDGRRRQQARRWRALVNEAQVVLHNHPWNARRAAVGKPPVNALWFWGAGVLPDHVATRHSRLQSNDPLARALAKAAGIAHSDLGAIDTATQDSLHDLRDVIPAEADRCMARTDVVRSRHRNAAAGITRFRRWHGFHASNAGQRWRMWRNPTSGLGA